MGDLSPTCHAAPWPQELPGSGVRGSDPQCPGHEELLCVWLPSSVSTWQGTDSGPRAKARLAGFPSMPVVLVDVHRRVDGMTHEELPLSCPMVTFPAAKVQADLQPPAWPG